MFYAIITSIIYISYKKVWQSEQGGIIYLRKNAKFWLQKKCSKKTVRLTNRENISQHATERTSKSSITKARQARKKNTLDQSTHMDQRILREWRGGRGESFV